MTDPTIRPAAAPRTPAPKAALRALAAPVAAVLGLLVLPPLAGDAAEAQTAARVESQTRPNFGLLLQPPAQTRPRAHRRFGPDRHHAYRPHLPPRPPVLEEVVLVDCGGNPGSGAIEAAVRRVRPGGTLILRARGGPCVGWLDVDRPMTILGDGAGFDPREWNRQPTATLQAPDGLPCLTVAPGVRVEVRDVVFASPNAGDAPCVANYGGQAILNRVGFRHAGDEPAVLSDGGLVDLRNAVVEAETVAPAILADGATLTAYEVTVVGATSGVDITPGAGEPSLLQNVTLRGDATPNNFGPRAIGLIVRAARSAGRVDVSNVLISDYAEGLAVEGASVGVVDSRITRVDKGVVLYNGELSLTRSRIRAGTVGVAAAAGRAVVTDNVFSGVREVFYEEPRAVIEASGNRVYSRELCRASYRPRWRDRHEPYWSSGGPGWSCVRDSYPRDWWEEEDGYFGYPYEDYGVGYPEGYDRFQQGYGWYDRDGRYVPDDRHVGDRRWGGGGFWR
jgi:hypothetical protein